MVEQDRLLLINVKEYGRAGQATGDKCERIWWSRTGYS